MNVTPFSRHEWLISTGTFALIVASGVCRPDRACAGNEVDVIDIGSRRELFVDDFLIERLSGQAELRLHHPVPREVVFTADRPWEGNLMFHVTVFRDGDIYRMYYRGWHYDERARRASKHKSRKRRPGLFPWST